MLFAFLLFACRLLVYFTGSQLQNLRWVEGKVFPLLRSFSSPTSSRKSKSKTRQNKNPNKVNQSMVHWMIKRSPQIWSSQVFRLGTACSGNIYKAKSSLTPYTHGTEGSGQMSGGAGPESQSLSPIARTRGLQKVPNAARDWKDQGFDRLPCPGVTGYSLGGPKWGFVMESRTQGVQEILKKTHVRCPLPDKSELGDGTHRAGPLRAVI